MVGRRRGRMLVRGAMVGGAAYYAGRRIAQGENQEAYQEQRLQALEAQSQPQYYQAPPPSYPPQPAQPPPPSAPAQSTAEQLTQLKQLLDSGVLTQAEFEVEKAKVLGR